MKNASCEYTDFTVRRVFAVLLKHSKHSNRAATSIKIEQSRKFCQGLH